MSSDPKSGEWDETRATARLPSLDVEVLHRRSWDGEDEQLRLTLTATPSFEATARMIEASNPMLLWMHLAHATWAPWLAMLGAPTAGLRVGGLPGLRSVRRRAPGAD